KNNLIRKGEPARGSALDDELKRVRRRFMEARLAEAGTERARFWGWTNVYTYTKSIGEQILAASGLPFTIVRPAVVESSYAYPLSGLLSKAAVGPAATLLKPASRALSSYAEIAKRNGDIWELYIPFMAETEYHFSCASMRAVYARLTEVDRAKLTWAPEQID